MLVDPHSALAHGGGGKSDDIPLGQGGPGRAVEQVARLGQASASQDGLRPLHEQGGGRIGSSRAFVHGRGRGEQIGRGLVGEAADHGPGGDATGLDRPAGIGRGAGGRQQRVVGQPGYPLGVAGGGAREQVGRPGVRLHLVRGRQLVKQRLTNEFMGEREGVPPLDGDQSGRRRFGQRPVDAGRRRAADGRALGDRGRGPENGGVTQQVAGTRR